MKHVEEHREVLQLIAAVGSKIMMLEGTGSSQCLNRIGF